MDKRILKRFRREHGRRENPADKRTIHLFRGEVMTCLFCSLQGRHPGKGIGSGWYGIELTQPSFQLRYMCPACIQKASQSVVGILGPDGKVVNKADLSFAQSTFMTGVTMAARGESADKIRELLNGPVMVN